MMSWNKSAMMTFNLVSSTDSAVQLMIASVTTRLRVAVTVGNHTGLFLPMQQLLASIVVKGRHRKHNTCISAEVEGRQCHAAAARQVESYQDDPGLT